MRWPLQTVDLIQGERLTALLERVITPHAAGMGMEARGDRVWVAPDGPIRRMLSFSLGKGAQAEFVWGVGLDFVPHVQSGNRVAWHRTLRAARMDLAQGALWGRVPTLRLARRYFVDLLHGEATAGRQMEQVWHRLEPAISDWYRRGQDETGLIEIATEHFERRDELPQASEPARPLAFLHARLGRPIEAQRWLGLYIAAMDLDASVAGRLRELLDSTEPAA